MTPAINNFLTLVAIALPVVVLVVAEVVRGLPGTPRRYYRRFLLIGGLHGLVLWMLFVRGNWHGGPDDWAGWMATLGLFVVGALFACLAFSAVYLGSAFALRQSRRFAHYVRKRRGVSIFTKER